MDVSTFRQLKESKYYDPILTEVMFEYDMMLEMVFHSMTIIEKGYDTVWDANIFDFTRKYFQEGMEYVGKLITDKGIRIRLIVEATLENIGAIDSLKHYEIRCLDDIKGNFGIFDNRAYMVYIFHRDSDKPDQTLWSNSRILVDKQRILFDKMWNIAIPLSIRRKELEYEKRIGHKKIITDYDIILNEIDTLTITCKKELIIFSSTKILCNILSKNNFVNHFPPLLKNDVKIKILIDNADKYLIKLITVINDTNCTNPIQIMYSNKISELNELVIISDDKYMLQVTYDINNQLLAFFSREEYNIRVQGILFEKHWNEIKSLSAVTNI